MENKELMERLLQDDKSSKATENSTPYYYDENWLIQYKYGKIHLSKPRFIAFRELRLLLELWKRHEKVAVGTRIIYKVLRPFYKKPIWILSDIWNILCSPLDCTENGFFNLQNGIYSWNCKSSYYWFCCRLGQKQI